jgi:hypothetical protein
VLTKNRVHQHPGKKQKSSNIKIIMKENSRLEVFIKKSILIECSKKNNKNNVKVYE